VPLPYWNPYTTVPEEFQGRQGTVDPTNTSIRLMERYDLVGVSPNFWQFDRNNPNNRICNGSFTDFTSDLEDEHGAVHVNLGGDFGNTNSTNFAIFWPWHAYIDIFYEDYKCLCTNDNNGHDNFYDAYNLLVNQFSILNDIVFTGQYITTDGLVIVPSNSGKIFIATNEIRLRENFIASSNCVSSPENSTI
jgi:hypothetical protein